MEEDISSMGIIMYEMFLAPNIGVCKAGILDEDEEIHHSKAGEDRVGGVDHLLAG